MKCATVSAGTGKDKLTPYVEEKSTNFAQAWLYLIIVCFAKDLDTSSVTLDVSCVGADDCEPRVPRHHFADP